MRHLIAIANSRVNSQGAAILCDSGFCIKIADAVRTIVSRKFDGWILSRRLTTRRQY